MRNSTALRRMSVALDLATRPAAMEPNALRDFLATFAPQVGTPLADDGSDEGDSPRNPPYSMVGSVAVVDVSGMLVPGKVDYPGWAKGFGAISDGITAAIADPAVRAIVLRVNSPGGYVTGCPECADAVLAARGKKPIVAFAETMAASAAYWIASACDKLYASKAALVGSIGVWNAHVDYTKRYADAGIKVTLIHAGARKVDGSPFRPMDEASTENMQGQVDAIWDMFAGAAAVHRGSTVDAMKAKEARMFMGEAAVKEGLADGVRSFEALVAELNVSAAPAAIPATNTPASSRQEKKPMADVTTTAPALADADRDELTRLRASEEARKITEADRAKTDRESVFAKHGKRLSPTTMATMREKLASVDAKAADEILAQIPTQVHPAPTGVAADPGSHASKLDPDLELLERAKALQKEKPGMRLATAVNEVLAADPKFAGEVKTWRAANPGPLVNLEKA